MNEMHGDPPAANAPAPQPGTPPVTQPLNIQSHFAWLRTRMSVERTMMSWNRTSLSLIGFGFTIYQFFEKFQESTMGANAARPEAPRNLGLALMLAGTLGTLLALWQYWVMVNYLRGEEFKDIGERKGLPHASLPFLITCLLALIGIVTTFWVLTRG
jgi:inner membrane protein YidH